MLFFHRTKWVCIAGITYKPVCAIVLEVKDDYPIFGRIVEIFVQENNKVAFYVRVMRTVNFLYHYHAYCIEQTDVSKLITVNSLLDPFPLHIRRLSSVCQVIIQKHHIIGTLR